tara:strand:- start:100 stop:303 length:204 start_codon:yes stop_codon:yes gene_type:complete
MKKKVKKMMEWFYDESDRGEKSISEVKDVYTMVENLQYRIEGLENEYLQLLVKMSNLEAKIDNHDHE